jgi:hypothetical protein
MRFCIILLKERDASKDKYPFKGIRQIHAITGMQLSTAPGRNPFKENAL